MLITVLERAHFPCGWLLGGLFADGVPPGRFDQSDWVVAEIDESDGTIDRFSPEITVVVNLDWDHPDHYRRLSDLETTFAGLFARTRQALFISSACALSAKLAAAVLPARIFRFGHSGDYIYSITGESGDSSSLHLAGKFGSIDLAVRARGEFNASNACAALAVASFLGIQPEAIGLADYPGVCRRQAILYRSSEFLVMEDYAHHPAEIRALLTALRRREAPRLVVVFQPHRYTRTAQFTSDFASALSLADVLFLIDVYPAGENLIPGGTTADIYAALKTDGAPVPIHYFPGDQKRFVPLLRSEMRKGDLVVFLGAGDIDQIARATVSVLENEVRQQALWIEFVKAVTARLSKRAKFIEDEPLATKNTLRVGGRAQGYAEPASESDLRVLLSEASSRSVPVHLLGRGSNLVIPDSGVRGLVISLQNEVWQTFEPLKDGCVWVGAGLRLKNLCGLASKAGLSGFEFLEGIPGSVGGALRMNAGAMGGWIFDVVEKVVLMDNQGEIHTLTRDEVHFGYRECRELQDAVAVRALLRTKALAGSEAVSRQIGLYAKKRKETQPREPSAGCMFKNPPGDSAGKIIDQLGLKGVRVGDAEVSTVHGNFIINRGQATSEDILSLVRMVRSRVKEVRGIDLEPEVLLYGQDWKDVL